MTSWEPYPQAKMSRTQEQAYAERQAANRGKKTTSRSSTSGRKRRVVRTAAGARRYKVPIGSEIGTARNAESAKWQRDKDSSNRYRSLVGTDKNAQSAALRGLVNGQLQRLARTAYSFKSSDPNVVRLRIGVANEMRRRGMNVNDYGGLGPKTKNPGPAGTWARDHAKRVAARKKASAAKKRKSATSEKKKPVKKTTPTRSAMSARVNDRRLLEMSVPQLRAAIRVFPKIPADKRQAVARILVKRALELAAPHFLGETVIEAANLPDPQKTQVIELAGRWKHGWIPLDGAAVAAKMKGRTGGKQWWGGGGGAVKGRVRDDGKMRVRGGVGVPKKTGGDGRPKMQVSSVIERKGGPVAAAGGRVHTTRGTGKATAEDLRKGGFGKNESRKAASFQSNETTGGKYAAQKRTKPSLAEQHKGDRFPVGVDGAEARKQKDGTFSIYRDGRKSRRPEDNGLTRAEAIEHSHQIHKTVAASDYQRAVGITQPVSSPRRKDYESRVARNRTAVVNSGSKPKEPKMSTASESKSNPTAPKLGPGQGTAGKKVAGAPAGYQAYSVSGTSLYDTVLVDGEGNKVGFLKKRSGVSTIGRSGSATYKKNTGYSVYDTRGRTIGTHQTRGGALEDLARRQGKA